MNPLLEAALAYAARGWPVIPLAWPTATGDDARCSCGSDKCRKDRRIGKHPHGLLVRRGLSEASVDEQRVCQWWAEAPRANVGLVLGEDAGMFAIDVDPIHAGDRTLVDLVRDEGPLGDTVHAFTGSGGDHYFFAYPAHLGPVRNRPCAPGIDVRGDGGYVVAAPSMHMSGSRYTWAPGPKVPLPAPAWLLARLFPPEPEPPPEQLRVPVARTGSPNRPDAKERAIAYLKALPPAIAGQNGHLKTWMAAVHMVRGFALDPREAQYLLETHFNPRCEPPWSVRELEHKVKSAASSTFSTGYLLDAT